MCVNKCRVVAGDQGPTCRRSQSTNKGVSVLRLTSANVSLASTLAR